MGRLPLSFAGKDITFRIPYQMPGELDVPPNQSGTVFPDVMFSHNVDKPFEVHRMIIRLVAKGTPEGASAPTILEPQPTTLEERVRIRVMDLGKNENMTKSPTLVSLLLNRISGAWDWEEPYTIVRSEGFQVQVDTQDFPFVVILDANIEPERVAVQFIRVACNFQGYIDIIGPPSEVR